MALDKDRVTDRIKELFADENQKAISERLHMTQGTISKIMSGKQNLTLDMAYLIAKEYDVSVDWLLGITDIRKVNTAELTYGDIFQNMLELWENKAICPLPAVMFKANDETEELPYVSQIGITDEILQSILGEWEGMIKKPIDREIYQIWRQKRIEEYSRIPYIPWDEKLMEYYREWLAPIGVNSETLKAFCEKYNKENKA